MPLCVLKQFNWVDIFVVIIILRIGYVALRNEFPAELFKLLGTVLAAYFALHYYTGFSDYLAGRPVIKNLIGGYLNFLFLILLAIIGYAIFVLLRSVFYRFIKMQAEPGLNKWGSLVLGLARGILVLSLVMYIFVASPLAYLKNSVSSSYSGKYLFQVAPRVYSSLWNGIVSKFMSQEKFNQSLLEIPESVNAKK